MATPNALTYNAWVTQTAALAVVDVNVVASVNQFADPRLQAAAPEILNYAELRLQRDLDLNQLLTSSAYNTTPNQQLLTVPAADFVSIQTMSVAGAPLLPVSKEWMQNVYGVLGTPAQPAYFAPYGGDQSTAGLTSTIFLLGPWPDQTYSVSVTGLQRAPSLYANADTAHAAVTTTWISTWLPDLLVTASMIWVSGLQRDFSPAGNDPQAPVNWESQYESLLRSAQAEEARKRFASSAWSANSQPVAASPSR